MMKLFKFAVFTLLCACIAAAQTPAAKTPAAQTPAAQAPAAQAPAAQTPATTQPATTNPQAGTQQVTKPMLEFANAKQAKIAWTSKQSADLVLQYSTDPNKFDQAADAIEHSGGDNHRATLSNLQPGTSYYVRMTDKVGQPVGPVYSFKTPAEGQPPMHEQPLQPK